MRLTKHNRLECPAGSKKDRWKASAHCAASHGKRANPSYSGNLGNHPSWVAEIYTHTYIYIYIYIHAKPWTLKLPKTREFANHNLGWQPILKSELSGSRYVSSILLVNSHCAARRVYEGPGLKARSCSHWRLQLCTYIDNNGYDDTYIYIYIYVYVYIYIYVYVYIYIYYHCHGYLPTIRALFLQGGVVLWPRIRQSDAIDQVCRDGSAVGWEAKAFGARSQTHLLGMRVESQVREPTEGGLLTP